MPARKTNLVSARRDAFQLPPQIAAKATPLAKAPESAAPQQRAKGKATPQTIAAGVTLQLTSADATDLLGCVLEGRDAAEADAARFDTQHQPERAELARAKHARLSKILAELAHVMVSQWKTS